MNKQLIIVRNDLRSKLRHGKLAAQVAHASMASFLIDKDIRKNEAGTGTELILPLSVSAQEWITEAFTKVVLRCDDEAHILQLQQLCVEVGIPHYLIRDEGRTVFAEPTHTCLGIGPFSSDALDHHFQHLKMY